MVYGGRGVGGEEAGVDLGEDVTDLLLFFDERHGERGFESREQVWDSMFSEVRKVG